MVKNVRNQKAQQRDELICQFGILISPLEELAVMRPAPTRDQYSIAIARVQAGDAHWRQNVKSFATFADDIIFGQEASNVAHVPEVLIRHTRDALSRVEESPDLDGTQSRFAEILTNSKSEFFKLLQQIPFDWEPEIFAANTPFTSYVRILETLSIVNQRFHYFDRYLKDEFFHLFLKRLDRKVEIRLITTAGRPGANAFGVADVTPVSNLARQEFCNYQLIQVDPTQLHDRNMRVDDLNFSLGPGTDRAGFALTNFGPADNSPEAQQEFDAVMAGGTVIHTS